MVFGALITYEDTGAPYTRRHYADTHALNPQRQYNLACWMFGWSPERMGAVASYVRLPKERAVRCATEYEQIRRGVETVFSSTFK